MSSMLEDTNAPIHSTTTTSIAVAEGKPSRSPIRRRSSLSAILERPNEPLHLAQGKPLPPLPQHSPPRLRPRSSAVSARQHISVASSLPTILQQSQPARAQGILPSRPAKPSKVFRQGLWNRRGDHLTEDGFVVYAPLPIAYPPELCSYPAESVGYRDHLGKEVPRSAFHAELPESLPRFGQPPLRPYEQFIVYV
ncbi:hypothetical protein R3P38DRAFT_3120474 [Favolaschia claudopus]|uniref:Uncharacterized protein n=1 Tax=Favolaschia claudopus TaxID=2862362 RepID=A0AAV9ZDJ6_9AGAR